MPALDDFLGTWRLWRRIADLRTGETGRLAGEVGFRPGAGGLVQHEEGMLTLSGRPPMTATRTYLWTEAPGRLVLRFADGQPFHDFDPDTPCPEAQHPCGQDLYRVRYGFRRWPNWRSVWRVTGPRKDLLIVSAFAPLAPATATRQKPRDATRE